MVNYKNGKIYKIVCNSTGDVYFGSTTQQKLASRMNTHRKHTSNLLSKIIIQRHNYSYCLVEKYECDNHDELYCRLRYYIDNYDCINKQTASNNKHIDNEPIQKQQKLYIQPEKPIVDKQLQPKINIEPQKKTHEPQKEVSFKKKSTEKDRHSYKQINTTENDTTLSKQINTKCMIDRRTRKNHHLLHFNKDTEAIKPQVKETIKKDIETDMIRNAMKQDEEEEPLKHEETIKLHQNNIDKTEKEKLIEKLPTATINKHHNSNNNTLKRLEKYYTNKPHNKTLKITEKIDVLDMLDMIKDYRKEKDEIM